MADWTWLLIAVGDIIPAVLWLFSDVVRLRLPRRLSVGSRLSGSWWGWR